MRAFAILSVLVVALTPGCQCGSKASPPSPSASAQSSTAPLTSASAAPKALAPAPVRQGSMIARGATDEALYIAEEDRSTLRVVPLPFDPAKTGTAVSLPGRPAQVLPQDGRILVTIRDPGMLLVLRPDPTAGLVEAARVSLPGDAWGIAITPDEKTALVSSAWTHRLSVIDLETLKVRSTLDLPREPRGIVIMPDGSRAYVSHLVGSALTRIDGITSDKPSARSITLPPSPLRTPPGATLDASLGYSLTLSPDGRRLYAARHALGANGPQSWFGAATVDVLLTRDDTPLAPRPKQTAVYGHTASDWRDDESGLMLVTELNTFNQPRAAVFRKSNSTLLVAAEAAPVLAELDAVSIDPGAMPLQTHRLRNEDQKAPSCGAPSGIALSKDDTLAWVYCRSTNTLATVELRSEAGSFAKSVSVVALGSAGADTKLEEGRRLFYDGSDDVMSEGLGCAGCHPEGRDDGHVWHEIDTVMGNRVFVGASHQGEGYARQTPMLAGRVRASGPYGWHAQNETLTARVLEGFSLHRWFGWNQNDTAKEKAEAIGYFVQKGLTPPPREGAELTPEAKKGKEIFFSEEAQCSRCHVGEEYTDRMAIPLTQFDPIDDFKVEKNRNFKTPSLLFVGGTPPYYHDGHAATLEELIEKNDDHMGKTNHLSKEEKAALVAFLKTL